MKKPASQTSVASFPMIIRGGGGKRSAERREGGREGGRGSGERDRQRLKESLSFSLESERDEEGNKTDSEDGRADMQCAHVPPPSYIRSPLVKEREDEDRGSCKSIRDKTKKEGCRQGERAKFTRAASRPL